MEGEFALFGDKIVKRLEDQSVKLMEETLSEIRATASEHIKGVPDEELRVCLYMFVLKVLDFVRGVAGMSPTAAPSDFKQVFLESGRLVMEAIDAQNSYTSAHSEKVARHSGMIAGRLGLTDQEIVDIEYAAHVHNIGMINTSQRLITSPRKLTDKELSAARNHCVVGAEILRPIEFLSKIVPMVRYHHTRFDGGGFPGGLKGDDLPLGARIISISDAYQAMISERPHRPAYSLDDALKEIDKEAGKQFDPKLVPIAHELKPIA